MSIFISYRRATTEQFACALEKALIGRNIRVFRDDSNILPGERYSARLDREVAACHMFVALVDHEYFGVRFAAEQDFVKRELTIALEYERELVPIIIGDVVWPPENVPPTTKHALAARQILRATAMGDEAERLGEVIERAHAQYRPRDESHWHKGGVYALAVGYLPVGGADRQTNIATDQEPIIVSSGADGTIKRMSLIAPNRDKPALRLHVENRSATALAIEGVGRATRVIAGFADTSVGIWGLSAGKLVRWHPKRSGAFVAAAAYVWQGGDRRLIYADTEGSTNVWPLSREDSAYTGLPIFAIAGIEYERRDAVLLASREFLQPEGIGDFLEVRDLETGSKLVRVPSPCPVRALITETLDGDALVVSGGDDGCIRTWDERLQLLLESPSIGAPVTALIEAGGVIVAGAEDGTIRAFRPGNLDCVGVPRREHDGAVTCLAHADLRGRSVIVSGGHDGAVRVFALEALWSVGSRPMRTVSPTP
jgi:WD40 repeat protein